MPTVTGLENSFPLRLHSLDSRARCNWEPKVLPEPTLAYESRWEHCRQVTVSLVVSRQPDSVGPHGMARVPLSMDLWVPISLWK